MNGQLSVVEEMLKKTTGLIANNDWGGLTTLDFENLGLSFESFLNYAQMSRLTQEGFVKGLRNACENAVANYESKPHIISTPEGRS